MKGVLGMERLAIDATNRLSILQRFYIDCRKDCNVRFFT